ncbi:MAG: methyltransferase domain-containing protein [Nanoarchaeota archaeon]|nr:methyltransferase domain-containing protein [Nanoarchaeota archaeon]
MEKYQSNYTDKYIKSDEYGKTYDKVISNKYESFIWKFEQNLLSEIYKKNFKAKDRIKYLDFACGTGRVINFFMKKFRFLKVVGMDTSKHMVDTAKKSINAEFVVGNLVENPNLLSEKFDMITSFRLFLNIENENRRKILVELRKKLNDDGILIVNNHLNRYSILGSIFRLRNLMGSKLNTGTRDGILNTMSEKEFRKVLEQSGFKIVEVKRFIFFPGRKNLVVLPIVLLKKVEKFLSKVPVINYFHKDQIFVCKKNENFISK